MSEFSEGRITENYKIVFFVKFTSFLNFLGRLCISIIYIQEYYSKIQKSDQFDNLTVLTDTSKGEMEKLNELNFLSQIPIKSGHKTTLQNRVFKAGEGNNFNLTVGNKYFFWQ